MPEREGLPAKANETETALGEGQAALWLGESLILALLEANLLKTDTILEAIDIVIEAKKAKSAEEKQPDLSGVAVTQLASISASIAAAKVAAASPAEAKRVSRLRKKPST
jgi:hypothetical protein